MRKLLFISTLFLLTINAKPQSATMGMTNGLKIWSYDRSGGIVGKMDYDSARNTLKQSGNQLRVIKDLLKYIKSLQARMNLAENVLQYIEKDGSIRYPIEFKTAWELWRKENQQY
jgi:hypothetical protein